VSGFGEWVGDGVRWDLFCGELYVKMVSTFKVVNSYREQKW